MSRALALLAVWLVVGGGVMASPPSPPFSPPASGVPSLHAGKVSTPSPAKPNPAPSLAPHAQQGWETLRRETMPESVGSPTGHLWRWLLGLVVALAIIKWGLPRVLNGRGKGQMAQWLTLLVPPQSEGTITVLDTRFLGAGAVHLVSVRGRTLLIGSTAQQVNLLIDLTEPEENTSTFDRVLAQSKPFAPNPSLDDEADQAEQALREFQQRLLQTRRRLAG